MAEGLSYRGHKIELHEGVYVYSDTKQPVPGNVNRACGHCGLENTKEGHDGCLGTLPYVMNACCGHGNDSDAYVQGLDGYSVHGKDARVIIYLLKQMRCKNGYYRRRRERAK